MRKQKSQMMDLLTKKVLLGRPFASISDIDCGICFSAEKPGWLQHATGMLLRAAFQIPPSECHAKQKRPPGGWSFLFGGEGGI
ncbi:MAG: hypothetical protein E7448_01865 [Ruminococcaceae bacterium]|nr:hypothetical protein [Oscillospiraceae bacterium]